MRPRRRVRPPGRTPAPSTPGASKRDLASGQAVAALALAVLAACSGSSAKSGRTEILVFAAASLTESFQEIAEDFHSANPTVALRFSFGPSGGLATQIREGAPADVFASAGATWMDAVVGDPGATDRALFAHNRLVVLVPRSNPARITRLEDLAKSGVKLVLAATGVPAGDYARDVLARAGLRDAFANVVSNEEDVKGVVQKVFLDEADAGIAYVTDVTPSVRDRLRIVGIPETWNISAPYEIAALANTRHRREARAFIAYMIGPGGRVLERYGFAAL